MRKKKINEILILLMRSVQGSVSLVTEPLKRKEKKERKRNRKESTSIASTIKSNEQ